MASAMPCGVAAVLVLFLAAIGTTSAASQRSAFDTLRRTLVEAEFDEVDWRALLARKVQEVQVAYPSTYGPYGAYVSFSRAGLGG